MRTVVLLLFFSWASSPVAQDWSETFRDPQDGAFDASEWLLEKKGFLPVPILVTEPAVGYGAGAALLFFRESIGEAAARSRGSDHVTPPDIYGVAFAATENGTTFAGAGGMVTFAEDRWRYRGGVGRPDANLDFYGEEARRVGYNLEGWVSTQQLLRRLGTGSTYLGARWIYLDLDARADPSVPLSPRLAQPRAVRSSGAGPVLEHDARDNFFTPSSGWFANLEALFYSPAIGGDEEYQTYRGRVFVYLPLAKAFVLGGRFDARAARGDVPFYQLPYVDLRGIPVLRYQDENSATAEAELRWNVTPRWALVAFLGAGHAGESVSAGGVGVRYLIARRLGLYMGIDIARGPEETAFYIQAGSAWR